MLEIDIKHTLNFISLDEIDSFKTRVSDCNRLLYSKSGKGNDYLGWLHLPSETTETDIERIEATAAGIASESDIIVVVGIGGSYLGARAVIDMLSNNFPQIEQKAKKKLPLILYAGQNLSAEYHADLLKMLDKSDYSLIVISKSGTTTEPAVAFRLLKKHIEYKYGKVNSRKRVIAVTDKLKGALIKLAESEGYELYSIPDDVGGRFSVLTPVGLLPIASAGISIKKLLEGARYMESICEENKSLDNNPSDIYAAVRNILYTKGKIIEILASFTPNMLYFIEWWKQLFGESEGKDGKGIFPAGVNFTSDLHSMGQLIQSGARNLFETVIKIEQSRSSLTVPSDKENLDGLNYLAGKHLTEINNAALEATKLAHGDGGVPNISLTIPNTDEESVGELIYFFEKSCALSGYLLGVNPFDQPGVEAYKTKMFRLLGKPGF